MTTDLTLFRYCSRNIVTSAEICPSNKHLTVGELIYAMKDGKVWNCTIPYLDISDCKCKSKKIKHVIAVFKVLYFLIVDVMDCN